MGKIFVLTTLWNKAQRAAPIGAARHSHGSASDPSKFRSGGHQSLASLVGRELLEVLDEA